MAVSNIRVAVVDDQTLIRKGLASLLALVPDLTVVGQAAGGREALALVAEQSPDVVLMDVRMPGMNGVAATRQIRVRYPSTRVIVLTTFDNLGGAFSAGPDEAGGFRLGMRLPVCRARRGAEETRRPGDKENTPRLPVSNRPADPAQHVKRDSPFVIRYSQFPTGGTK